MNPSEPISVPAEGLVLQAPAPVAIVAPENASSAVPLPPADTAKLDGQVARFVDEVTSLDIHGADFKARVDAIGTLGDDDVRQAAALSNRLLERPVNAMNGGLFNGESPVSKSLLDLRRTIESSIPHVKATSSRRASS